MKSIRLSLAVVLAVLILAAAPARIYAQSDLEQRLSALEKRIDSLEQRVDAALAKTGSAPVAAPAPDRLASLDAKVAALEKQSAEVKAKVEKSSGVVTTVGKDGFSVASADKQYSLKVGGYGQFDTRTFYDDKTNLNLNAFTVRRARMNFDANLGKLVALRIAPELGNGSLVLYDAYVDLKFSPYFNIRGGKQKTVYGLELLQADTDMAFIERSLVNDLVPNRDIGVGFYGAYKKKFSYSAIVSNGMVDGAASVDSDVNDAKDLTARVFFTPFADTKRASLQGLGFGVGVSTGRQNGVTLPTYKTTGGQSSFFSYAAGVTANGNRLRYSPQMYYYVGSFGFLAEYAETAQDLILGSVKGRIVNHAWQAGGSYLLTGEKKSFGRLTPKHALDGTGLKSGKGWGAWELAARINELNVDPKVYTRGFAKSSASAESARSWTVGVNWYPSYFVRISADYDQTHFLKGAAVGNRRTEKTFTQRIQFLF